VDEGLFRGEAQTTEGHTGTEGAAK